MLPRFLSLQILEPPAYPLENVAFQINKILFESFELIIHAIAKRTSPIASKKPWAIGIFSPHYSLVGTEFLYISIHMKFVGGKVHISCFFFLACSSTSFLPCLCNSLIV